MINRSEHWNQTGFDFLPFVHQSAAIGRKGRHNAKLEHRGILRLMLRDSQRAPRQYKRQLTPLVTGGLWLSVRFWTGALCQRRFGGLKRFEQHHDVRVLLWPIRDAFGHRGRHSQTSTLNADHAAPRSSPLRLR